jgi:hypothetical protein
MPLTVAAFLMAVRWFRQEFSEGTSAKLSSPAPTFAEFRRGSVASGVPRGELRRIERAGHMLEIVRPDEVARAIVSD